MPRYLLGRIIATIPVVVLITVLVFLLIHAAPGDPADLLLSEEASAADIAEARHRWGLDQPIYIQYGRFLANIASGDLGISFRYSDPVISLIRERLPATIELAIASMLIALIVGIPLGVWAGAKPNSWADNLGSVVGFFGISMPSFWLGIMLILIISGYFNWLPSSGRSTYGVATGYDTGFYILESLLSGNMKAVWDGIKHIIDAEDHRRRRDRTDPDYGRAVGPLDRALRSQCPESLSRIAPARLAVWIEHARHRCGRARHPFASVLRRAGLAGDCGAGGDHLRPGRDRARGGLRLLRRRHRFSDSKIGRGCVGILAPAASDRDHGVPPPGAGKSHPRAGEPTMDRLLPGFTGAGALAARSRIRRRCEAERQSHAHHRSPYHAEPVPLGGSDRHL